MTVQEAITSFKNGCSSPLNYNKKGTFRYQFQTDVFDIDVVSGMIRLFQDGTTSTLVVFHNLDKKNLNDIPFKFKISNSVYKELKDLYIKELF